MTLYKTVSKMSNKRLENKPEESPLPEICAQCGSPLNGNRCEYCETRFSFPLNNYIGPDQYALGKKLISYAGYDVLGNKIYEFEKQL